MLGLFGGLNGPWEIILILVVALLLFGKRLPEVARSLGKGIVEFKKGLKGVEDEVRNADAATPLPRPPSASTALPPSSAAGSEKKSEPSLKDTTSAT